MEAEEVEYLDDDAGFDKDEDYGDVLQLTHYDDKMLESVGSDGHYYAEYHPVVPDQIEQKYVQSAKNFVDKITKFILDYDDVELSEAHRQYLEEVGRFQITNLTDMLSLVETNKQMLANIIRRLNASNGDDYAALEAYNKMTTQHLKFIRELQQTYKQIPLLMKKMRNDILLESKQDDDQAIKNAAFTEAYGQNQFNNQKEMIRKIKEDYEKRKAAESTMNGSSSYPSC